MPNIKKISKTVEIIHAVGQAQVPNIAKTYEIPQAQFMPRRGTTNSCAETVPNAQEIQIGENEVVDMPVVKDRRARFRRVGSSNVVAGLGSSG